MKKPANKPAAPITLPTIMPRTVLDLAGGARIGRLAATGGGVLRVSKGSGGGLGTEGDGATADWTIAASRSLSRSMKPEASS
jgi:hypothetical protein